ncbi:MAG TPA: adenylyltransferase/cytidyltransferase family protein [Nitrososphaeraceae archaeon]|nr:adenylyltransferase/cytidyltransferase family protein [Nitrososphaeraceae archaeon]
MDLLDKKILSSLYLSSIAPETSPYERIWSASYLPKEVYDRKIEELHQKGLVDKNYEPQISFIGRDAIKVVLVGGVFDLIHPGHIHTLKAAKSHGDVLVVVIARTSTARKIRGERKIFHDESLRKELVSSLHFVDLAIIGREGTLYDTVEHVRPDIIALGYDQAHTEKDIAQNCARRKLNVKVIRLNTPLPVTKSSKIKDDLGDSFYNT